MLKKIGILGALSEVLEPQLFGRTGALKFGTIGVHPTLYLANFPLKTDDGGNAFQFHGFYIYIATAAVIATTGRTTITYTYTTKSTDER